MNIDKPCHNSSCEPTATGRRSKKAHGLHRCTRSLLHGFFLTFVFWCTGIINGFASVTACGCWEKWRNNVRWPEGKPIIQFRVYCPKESKCHALAGFVLFVRFVFEKKHSRMLSWPRISRIPRIYTGSQPKRFVRFVRFVFEKNIRVC